MNNKTGQHEKRTETPVPADAPAAWAYILAKIDLYLSLGAKKYRKLDALHMPDAAWDEDTLQDILRCFQQFAAGKGYRADKPTEGVTVGGFYAAMQTLHFSLLLSTLGPHRSTYLNHKHSKKSLSLSHSLSFFFAVPALGDEGEGSQDNGGERVPFLPRRLLLQHKD